MTIIGKCYSSRVARFEAAMTKVKMTREPIRSVDTFDSLDGDDHSTDNDDGRPPSPMQHQQQRQHHHTPQQLPLSIEAENKALRSELERNRIELDFWKAKASGSEDINFSPTESPLRRKLDQTGLWERGITGLRKIISTPERSTLKSKNSFIVEIDSSMDEEGLQLHASRMDTGLHHRKTAIPTMSYFEKCAKSPSQFYNIEDTNLSDALSDGNKEDGASLVFKSRSSDRDIDSLQGSHDTLEPTYYQSLLDRGAWLVGLLILQSFSSFILKNNEELLQRHAVIVRFLTMLVGAGGNAGNQASVRVIRGLATGKLDDHKMRPYLKSELKTGFYLSAVLGIAGCIRAAVFFTPLAETVAITSSLVMIVAISIVLGTMLPLMMRGANIDPAHSSTTIQVIMDVLGVAITVHVSSVVLESEFFPALSNKE